MWRTSFWLGLFVLYCIAYHLNRYRVYRIRKQRAAGNDAKVVADLPAHDLFAYFNLVVRIPFVTELIPVKRIIGVSVFVIMNLIFIFFVPLKTQADGHGYVLATISIFDRRSVYVGVVNWGFVFVWLKEILFCLYYLVSLLKSLFPSTVLLPVLVLWNLFLTGFGERKYCDGNFF